MQNLKSKFDAVLNSDWKVILIWYLIWLSALLLISFLVHLSQNPINVYLKMLNSLANWDGGNYIEISRSGYQNPNLTAFFPFFPILIAIFSAIFPIPEVLIGAFLNIVFSYLAIVYFYKLTKLKNGEKYALKSIFYLLIFPTSFFLIATYPESIFLFFIVFSFYCLEIKNDKLIFISTFFASLTRPQGILLGFCLNRGIGINKMLIFSSLMGLLVYCLYLFLQFGNPFLFLNIQAEWGRRVAFPGFAIWDELRYLFSFGFDNQSFRIVTELIFTTFGLGLCIRSFRILPKNYAYFCAFFMLLPLFTNSLLSIPRFMLMIFPYFMILALSKRKYFMIIYSIFSTVTLVIFWVMFNLSWWVA